MCFFSKQEKKEEFKNECTPILFHLFARILGTRTQLLSKTLKIRKNQIVQLTIYRIQPLRVVSASNPLQITSDCLLKSGANIQNLGWRIWNRVLPVNVLKWHFKTLPETAGVHWSKALSLSYSHKMLSGQTRIRNYTGLKIIHNILKYCSWVCHL